MDKVYIIGAGQLGSRHLQALKSVNRQLDIYVIDPSTESLNVAQNRFNEIKAGMFEQRVTFSQEMVTSDKEISIAIIATSSGSRKKAIEDLLKNNKINNLVLEKLLFTEIGDLEIVSNLIKKNKINAWVNCPMRMMPFYQELQKSFCHVPIIYQLSGSMFGLVTNLIHYIDYMIYLTGCRDFKLDLSLIDKEIISSKRKGYYELTGTAIARFNNGSVGFFTCYNEGNLGAIMNLVSSDKRVIINEGLGKAYWQPGHNDGTFLEQTFRIPFQSEMTKELVETILDSSDCMLPTYDSSANTHRLIMKPIINLLKENTDYNSESFLFT